MWTRWALPALASSSRFLGAGDRRIDSLFIGYFFGQVWVLPCPPASAVRYGVAETGCHEMEERFRLIGAPNDRLK